MNKEELWKRYCEKNPEFTNPEKRISITVRGLKKLFEQTYDLAYKAGLTNPINNLFKK